MDKSDIEIIIKTEGDDKQWEYKTQNEIIYKCEILRVKMGFLCGYVKLTKDDTFYNVHYDDLPIKAHGGVTYSQLEDDLWVIGFDCGHHGDLIPTSEYFDRIGIYRDMEYVSRWCEHICEQLSEKNIHLSRDNKIKSILNE